MVTDDRTIHEFRPQSATTTSSTIPRERATRIRRGVVALMAALAVVVGIGAGALGVLAVAGEPETVIVERAVTVSSPVVASGSTTTGVDATAIGIAVVPSVVTVEIGAIQQGAFAQFGSGSGVVFDGDGLIVTNNHVVEDADAVRVVLSDGRVYDATIVGTDPLTDLAVLSVGATGLTPIEFGATTALQVGDPAVAVGSPLGLQGGPSLTVGVISALGREVQTDAETILFGMLQTDAPITNGSSGGSLVDIEGRLIGITTAVGVSEGGQEGIGFATPIEIVERVIAELAATGAVDHALLGITGGTAYTDTGDGGQQPTGVEVETVQDRLGAATAGIVTGDVITSIGGSEVRTMDELITVLRSFGAGDAVTVDLADGRRVSVTLTSR